MWAKQLHHKLRQPPTLEYQIDAVWFRFYNGSSTHGGMMAILAQDTTDADEQREIAFWRSLPVWRKMEIIGDLYESAENLALADLRRRHPSETHEQLYARLLERRKLLEQL